ncbi:MAG: nuclear transport factor 2 family protein [Gemmatimonadales bacterium]
MLHRSLLLCCTCLLAPAAGSAQAADPRAEVTAVITRLIDGMRESDSTKVRSAFHAAARLGSALMRDGVPSYRPDGVDGFVRAVGTPKEIMWDERIRHLRLEVDGPLATAWMEYRFYAGERFSHCGVNAMQLVRGADGWQIASLIDTRRQPAECEPWP